MRRSSGEASLSSRMAASAVLVADQPAVAERVGGLEAEHRHGGTGRERRSQPLIGRRLDERRVGERDDHVVLGLLQGRRGGKRGMRGAEALGLGEDLGAWQEPACLLGDILPIRTDHHRNPCRAGLAQGGQRMGEHRAAGNLVQNLGPRRFHPRALPGCQHHGKAGAGARRGGSGSVRHGQRPLGASRTYQDFAAIRNAWRLKGRTGREPAAEIDPLLTISYIVHPARPRSGGRKFPQSARS